MLLYSHDLEKRLKMEDKKRGFVYGIKRVYW